MCGEKRPKGLGSGQRRTAQGGMQGRRRTAGIVFPVEF
ncbi:hypothetical protein TcasGA2_TC033844 [Tribolium castaneum]|uniref:Uncharacterized protein n=1 Tax=Tribolium castaneum TaxID=7070 RepID=A0A139WFB7_TRICA|nr:hypothetical protein TcasGA2_TC033844 [Tribolium castaneum]